MKDKLDIFERAAQSLFVGQACLVKINLAAYLFQIFPVACREIINNAHASPACGQCRSDMRPDKTSAARD
jgi:hypothetical protein